MQEDHHLEDDAESDSDLSSTSSASFDMSKVEAVIAVLKQKQEASHENAAKTGLQQLTVPAKAWCPYAFYFDIFTCFGPVDFTTLQMYCLVGSVLIPHHFSDFKSALAD